MLAETHNYWVREKAQFITHSNDSSQTIILLGPFPKTQFTQNRAVGVFETLVVEGTFILT